MALKFIVALSALPGYNTTLIEPSGNFLHRRAHPEERSDEGSLEILPRFARQDEWANVEKHPAPSFNNDEQKGSREDRCACHR